MYVHAYAYVDVDVDVEGKLPRRVALASESPCMMCDMMVKASERPGRMSCLISDNRTKSLHCNGRDAGTVTV